VKLRLLFIVSGVLFCNLSSAGTFPEPTGPAGLPFNENQTGPLCSTSGWSTSSSSHQYHMEYNSSIGKFHMGEDWNGKCGGDTDEGYPLLAIADGEAVSVKDESVEGQGKRLYLRHAFPYSQNPAGVMVVESAMLHLQKMGAGIVDGAKVKKGQTVAYLGKTGTASAHLHWEMRYDLSTEKPLGTNPYNSALTIDMAIKYLPPSLVVDDRRYYQTWSANNSTWTYYKPFLNSPSSLAYVKKDGEVKSLRHAIEAGWITSRNIQFKKSDGWYYYPNSVDSHFFEAGKDYRVMSTLSGVTYYLPIPNNKFQPDRARVDMINAVRYDDRFVSFDTVSHEIVDDWHPDWILHKMTFTLDSGEETLVAQITNKANPLKRQTNFIDPDTGAWSGFKSINWNKLC
jgi:hypothetical protein